MIFTKINKENMSDEYDCLLQYDQYSKVIIPYLEFLLTLDNIKDNHLISKCIKKLLSKTNIERVFKLKKLFSLSKTKIVHCCISLDKNNNSKIAQTIENMKKTGKENNINENNNNNNIVLLTSSDQELSLFNVSKNSNQDYKSRKERDSKKSKAESQTVQKYFFLTAILSFVILIASFICIFHQSSEMAQSEM